MEIENNDQLFRRYFNDNNFIIFNLFQKSIFSRRYLNFNSQHLLEKKKKEIIMGI